MSNKIYSFNGSNNDGKQGEEVIKKYLLNNPNSIKYLPKITNIEDVSSNKFFQTQDIDFFVICDKGNVSVEVKTDLQASKTGNIFFETESIVELGSKGCLLASKAEILAYYIPSNHTAYFIDLPKFQKWFTDNSYKFPPKTVQNFSHTTKGRLISIEKLEQMFPYYEKITDVVWFMEDS